MLGKLRKKKQYVRGGVAPGLPGRPAIKPQESAKKSRVLPLGKRKLVIIALVLAAVLAAGAVYLFVIRDKSDLSVARPCSSDEEGSILREAVYTLDPVDLGRLDGLEALVQKIKQYDNYAKDPNCLYPVLRYEMSVGRFDTARDTFDQLKSVYTDDSFAIGLYNTTIDTIQSQVDSLRILEEASGRGSLYISPPPGLETGGGEQ